MKTYFQKLGRSLMLPISILPVASILVGIANWIGAAHESAFTIFLATAGNSILGALPILFAVGISVGMSKDKDGAAAMSGLVGYLVLTKLLAPASVSQLTGSVIEKVDPAFNQIENVFVGIICGVVAAELYNRFSKTQLPTALAFFSGKRLVPILTATASLVLAGILFVAWPVLYAGLVAFGSALVDLGPIGAGIYGFANRMLIPTGLHHALNSVFWFDVVGINDIGNFLASKGTKGITGMYQAGFFPIMMFALPAAALAIYKNAKPERKKMTGSLMLAAGFATFFTGVTEPLEFSFMFVAPALYVIHAILTGLSFFIVAFFHWTSGFAFSAGLVDYMLSLVNPIANKPYMLLLVGVIMAVIYYFVFDFMIKKLNLKTPGREEGEVEEATESGSKEDKYSRLAQGVYTAIGGSDNIRAVDNCTTRLRLELEDSAKADQGAIKALGLPGVNVINKHSFQVVVGTDVQFVADELAHLYQRKAPMTAVSNEEVVTEVKEKVATESKTAEVFATTNGQLKNISEVKDEVFSQKMMGDGFAIEPRTGEVFAPVTGVIQSVFPTKHAVTILADNGAEVLIHIGINTVELAGKPFDVKVSEGDHVAQGDLLVNVDLDQIAAAEKVSDVIVVFVNQDDIKELKVDGSRPVSANEVIGTVTV